MPSKLLMPQLSPGMEKGNLFKWHRKDGESFRKGDVLLEVETDKAVMEVNAEHDGALATIVVPEGTADVAVNEPIAILLAEGEALDCVAPVQDIAAPHAEPAPDITRNGRLFASPAARRVARETGISLEGLKGSGPSGRIVRKDVLHATMDTVRTAAATHEASAPYPYAEGTYDAVAHDEMRRTIAARLTQAVQTIPQFYLSIDCEMEQALQLRERLNVDGMRVSLTDLILKAYAMAFIRVPDANVTWSEHAMLRHKHVDVGLAVALPGQGLITPIVRQPDAKPLAAIAAEVQDLVARAKARRLRPEEFRGGTTALSNLGMFGVSEFSAIVNPPHATILAVGAARHAAVVKNGALVPATVLTATLTCDHRAIDGALGAELLGQFRQLIERPQALQE